MVEILPRLCSAKTALVFSALLTQQEAFAHIPGTGEFVLSVPLLRSQEVSALDVTDGSLRDWREVLGEPTLGITTLFQDPTEGPYGLWPSSFDVQIWIAVDPERSRVYLAVERWDDKHEDEPVEGYFDGQVELMVDGDHSGQGPVEIGGAQRCSAIHARGGELEIKYESPGWVWLDDPQFIDGSGAFVEEDDQVHSTLEFYMTAFDAVDPAGLESSSPSRIVEGAVVGLSVLFVEVDPYEVLKVNTSNGFAARLRESADSFGDALMTPWVATSLHPAFWGQIKRGVQEGPGGGAMIRPPSAGPFPALRPPPR